MLADLEAGLLALESGEGDGETVNAVFRAVHSIKGGGGAFGLEPLVRFAHVFETALDQMRTGELGADPDTMKVMLRAADMLARSRRRRQGRWRGRCRALCGDRGRTRCVARAPR